MITGQFMLYRQGGNCIFPWNQLGSLRERNIFTPAVSMSLLHAYWHLKNN